VLEKSLSGVAFKPVSKPDWVAAAGFASSAQVSQANAVCTHTDGLTVPSADDKLVRATAVCKSRHSKIRLFRLCRKSEKLALVRGPGCSQGPLFSTFTAQVTSSSFLPPRPLISSNHFH